VKKWLWPGDTAADAAKRIALSYRGLALSAHAGDVDDIGQAVTDLDNFWAQLGASWVQPSQAPVREDDWLTAIEIAELLGIKNRAVYDMGRRGHVEVDVICGERRYRVGDAIDYLARSRRARQRIYR